ncbi:671_t:CDS:2 [Funneliformis geosporum]|uniref:671_t:CDS:1 n=1 Tax=Funneliformis geosporum TaxID=1117311 RepID=A0A9W4T1G6_9GLOM|nr:671_t:CDS:2 [Funneliformis geosporum]
MAIEIEGSTERINRTYRYVLRLYNGETLDECEEKVNKILSSIVKSYKIEHIKAFSFRGYHTEKKSYLRIYTNGTGERKKAIQAIQENNFETASDDLYSFY